MPGTILIGVAGVLLLFGAVVAADLVFGVLNDLRQFESVLILFGSPWEKGNGTMTIDWTRR